MSASLTRDREIASPFFIVESAHKGNAVSAGIWGSLQCPSSACFDRRKLAPFAMAVSILAPWTRAKDRRQETGKRIFFITLLLEVIST